MAPSSDDTYVPPLPVIYDRQKAMRIDLNGLLDWRRDVDEDRVVLEVLRKDVQTVKRLMITLLVSVVTGSASITIAVLLATRGK